jgi:hypothetical protein
MNRLVLPLVLAAHLAACDAGPRVVVRAAIDGRPLADVPVRLLPYDRRALLDSLTAAADAEEPPVPQEAIQRLRSLAAEEATVKARGDTAVARWQAERARFQAVADRAHAARRAWNDTVFRDFDAVSDARAAAAGRPVVADTTDPSGTARMTADEGEWWVSLQYVLADEQLDWVVPVTIGEATDSLVVTLTRENAVVKPYF